MELNMRQATVNRMMGCCNVAFVRETGQLLMLTHVIKECLQSFPEDCDHKYNSLEIKAAIEDVQLVPSTVVRRRERS
jgi:hypothetical protein